MANAHASFTHRGTTAKSPLGATCPVMSNASVMTPIVFCASWRPWPQAIAAEDAHWPYLKPRVVRVGRARRNSQRMTNMSRSAPKNPTTGETTIGMTTFLTIVSQCTVVPDASAAPTNPPMRACEDDDGNPKYHVTRFQAIAPATAANTTTSPCDVSGASMMLPTVLATLTDTSDPARLKTAASARAARGVSALVDTDVAIALAASWKPLV